MSFPFDPADLDAIADRIAGHAHAARERASGLAAALAPASWRGVAAAAFEAEAQLTIAALRSAAGRLDEAADALRRHATRVRAVLADVADLGLDAVHTAEDLARDPGHLLDDAGRLVRDGAGLVGDALGLLGL
jgi:uncharacterized protein YukE